jgi:arginase
MTAQLRDRVGDALAAGRFPFVFGGDCSILLGIVPALAQTGLLFLDGHEDTMPLDVSEDGEAANAEIGLLLGLTGRLLTGPLAASRGTLRADQLAVLGPRDEQWRRRFNVGSLREHGVWLRDADEVAARPSETGREAVQHLSHAADGWWLHIDLDVLDPAVFPAQGLPDFPDDPGGLTWDQLTATVSAVLAYGGCAGASITIYDPDQDPSGDCARRIVRAVREIDADRPVR